MKYLFFGTPEFAAIVLEKLINAGYTPEAVVTNPDRPFGRKHIVTSPPVKVAAQKHDIAVIQPEKTDNYLITQLLNYRPDLLIIAAYGKILPKKIIGIPKFGTIGVHPSLLPKYRGPTPIQSAILNGEKETGVTLYLMDEKTDHGSIIAKRKWQIANGDNYASLMKKLAELAGDLLIETLPKFLRGEIKPQTQNEAEATYTKKITMPDAYVDLEKDDPAAIDRKIRALNPEPGTWTMQNGKRVKLLEAELIDGKLRLKKIQVEGKRPQEISN